MEGKVLWRLARRGCEAVEILRWEESPRDSDYVGPRSIEIDFMMRERMTPSQALKLGQALCRLFGGKKTAGKKAAKRVPKKPRKPRR